MPESAVGAMEQLLWCIGSEDGKSDELVDNYKDPNMLGEVVWKVGEAKEQQWPIFHPSEADPDGGYRSRPYTILFDLDHEPSGTYQLAIQYLVIAPRLAHLEIRMNGVSGLAFPRPSPSDSDEIRLMSGLHTSIYSEGTMEVCIPADCLRRGENRLELWAKDGEEFIREERAEAVKRLDRMANGAGIIYQYIALKQRSFDPGPNHRAEVIPTVFYRRDASGKLTCDVRVYVEFSRPWQGGPLSLTFQEGKQTKEAVFHVPPIRFGHFFAETTLFDGEGEVAWILAAPEWRKEGTFRRRRKWKVFVAPHAHTDIGYTHRQWEVAERLCRNIDFTLDLLDRQDGSTSTSAEGEKIADLSPSVFAYHLDASWVLETYLKTRSPHQIEKLWQAVQSKHIGVAGNYADLLTQYAALEDLIRNQTVTEMMLRPAGAQTEFNTAVDVASLSGSLPALLQGAGIRYLVHANNQDRGPFRLNGGLHRFSPFWWEGVGGGRIMVWLSKMYCELRKVCGSPPMPEAAKRGLSLWLDEYERENYHPDAVLLYGQEADNTDLDPQPVEFLRRWNERYEFPRLIPCDVNEFFQYIDSRFGHDLPTFRGDGGAYWEDGVGSSIQPTIRVRQAQAALPAAERLEALAAIHNDAFAFPLEDYDKAWRDVFLYDEHTWGAFLSCHDPDALLSRDQWEVKEGFARSAHAWAKRLLHGAAVRHSLNWNNEGREVVVYNPHSWPVSGKAIVEVEPDETLVDAKTEEPIPQAIVSTSSTQVLVAFWVDDLPGLSYRRFPLKRMKRSAPAQADPQCKAFSEKTPHKRNVTVGRVGDDVVMENDFFRVTVTPAVGAVTSLFDKTLNRELVDDRDDWGFGQLLYARGGEGTRLVSNQGDWPDGNPDVRGEFHLKDCRIDHNDLGVGVTIVGDVPCGKLSVTWTLAQRSRSVDVQYRLEKIERRDKEAVYIAFPLRGMGGATIRSDSHLGWVDWHREQLPGGCKEWLPLQSGIHIAGEDAHVFIASRDIPLFTIGDVVRGRWPKEMDLTGGRVFSYVLNNYWHTNYKASQGGTIVFSYRLFSGETIPLDAAYRWGWQTRQGLYAHRISFQDFRTPQPPYESRNGGVLARLDTDRVALTTIHRARWTDGYVARLQEIAGMNQRVRLTIPGRMIRRAWLTDLLERETEPLDVEDDGSIVVPVKAWGLTTVRFDVG